MRFRTYAALCFALSIHNTYAADIEQLLGMSLEELTKLRVVSSATLTSTEKQKVPASVTRISKEMIELSGARSLDELLEYYVPNLAVLEHHGAGQHMGIRGIISDLDNKMILLVNGRVMNHRAVYGVITERYISMLGDIEYIDVIRGPGSALYGSGAIAGVIDIRTQSARTFDGTSVAVRKGVVEDFSSMELKVGRQADGNRGWFFYYGLDDYRGASGSEAPGYISNEFDRFSIQPGYVYDLPAQHGSKDLRHKLHLEYSSDKLDAYLRYTYGGIEFRNPYFFKMDYFQTYTQLTTHLFYKHAYSDTLSLELSGGLDYTEVKRYRYTDDSDDVDYYFPEEEANIRALMKWTPSVEHSFAFGGEFSREIFGEDHLGIGDYRLTTYVGSPEREPWATNTYSLLGEYQWRLNDSWVFFAGGRLDKHTHTDWMSSPKLAMVWTPSDEQRIKLIYNGSVRKTDDEPLQQIISQNLTNAAEVEELDQIELQHEITHSDALEYAYTLFYYDWEALGYSTSLAREGPIGVANAAGIELELQYHYQAHELNLSHSYTQLLDLKLTDSSQTDQNISSEPYGYGNDFLNWSPHITKLNWRWYIKPELTMNSSLQVFWGFPGASDYARYNLENLQINGRTISDGRQKAFRESVYLNTGLNYQVNDKLKAGLHFYNVLGWLDEDLNKRNRFIQMGQYRNEAAAAALSVRYEF
ncbi:TonB-dependent receptor plug domain-containing protein [Vibrio sp. JC009]|uniref:TonB-dependent receptor plug domain-containing protein n=1 Tax=Vibrio sp. JC009 TaxID=2912314 RepID=UPI0023B1A28B|nr:TonB-dependent receptor plug domain-containing protein [Vibrio sp. JC009]WED20794.1 TonB-dependent receptor plug domain-containing protein [Vibrio sp. JC009]